jgi:anti-anti-sigma factor
LTEPSARDHNKKPVLVPGLSEEQMEVFASSLSGVPLLRVVGDVDHSSSPSLDAAAQKVLVQGSGRILLDLTECPYLDSGGLGVLLSIVGTVKPKGWVGIIGANHDLLRLFEIVGLLSEPCFRVFAGEDEAAAVLSDASQ